MTRFTLHVPERHNDGSPVAPARLEVIESSLLAIGGGFTLAHGVGAWRSDDGTIYREPVRLYAVDTAEPDAGDRLRALAADVAWGLEQEAVYLTAQAIDTTLATAAV